MGRAVNGHGGLAFGQLMSHGILKDVQEILQRNSNSSSSSG